jgi:hypothetical protein
MTATIERTLERTRPTRRAVVPAPRPASDDPVDRVVQPHLPGPRYPWPEPWGSYRGASPRSEYWDASTASWRSRGPHRR